MTVETVLSILLANEKYGLNLLISILNFYGVYGSLQGG